MLLLLFYLKLDESKVSSFERWEDGGEEVESHDEEEVDLGEEGVVGIKADEPIATIAAAAEWRRSSNEFLRCCCDDDCDCCGEYIDNLLWFGGYGAERSNGDLDDIDIFRLDDVDVVVVIGGKVDEDDGDDINDFILLLLLLEISVDEVFDDNDDIDNLDEDVDEEDDIWFVEKEVGGGVSCFK